MEPRGANCRAAPVSKSCAQGKRQRGGIHALQRPARTGGKATIRAMEIQINGTARTVPDNCTVAYLIDTLGYAGKRVAIERNGDIVPRSAHADTVLRTADRIEIVVAVGGG